MTDKAFQSCFKTNMISAYGIQHREKLSCAAKPLNVKPVNKTLAMYVSYVNESVF
jgi:hypothetical protein